MLVNGGVGSVELRNPQAVLGRLGCGRSNVAVVGSHSPVGMMPLEVNLASWVAELSGLILSDGWSVVFAANGGIQVGRAVDLTGH
jgi:hypothetical protein